MILLSVVTNFDDPQGPLDKREFETAEEAIEFLVRMEHDKTLIGCAVSFDWEDDNLVGQIRAFEVIQSSDRLVPIGCFYAVDVPTRGQYTVECGKCFLWSGEIPKDGIAK